MRFEEKSYRRHEQHASDATVELPSVIKAPHTVDAWRHRRMTDFLDPFFSTGVASTWLTLGDARYGSDAYMLLAKGAKATASNISDSRLEISASLGHIGAYSQQNAEHIEYEDETFDYVLCKEAYHHFPRPPIAFYEMLRVARRGAILIEPYEGRTRILDWFKEVVKRTIRKEHNSQYEREGNYVYRTNVHEVTRAMTALDLPTIAYRCFNDFYVGRFSGSGLGAWSLGLLTTRLGIFIQGALSRLGLMNPGLICLVAFKEEPSGQLRDELKRSRFRILDLPRNPYVD